MEKNKLKVMKEPKLRQTDSKKVFIEPGCKLGDETKFKEAMRSMHMTRTYDTDTCHGHTTRTRHGHTYVV